MVHESIVLDEAVTLQARQLSACEAAMAQARKQPGEALHILVDKAKDGDYIIRIKAAECLMEVGTERAIMALMDLLDDPHPQVRFTAIGALGNLRARIAVDRIKNVLRVDPDVSNKVMAARVLGRMGNRCGLNTIVRLIYEGSGTDLRMAVVALRDIIGQAFSPTLEGIRAAKRYLEFHGLHHYNGDGL
jgi:HEAT repeat protein